MEQTPLVSIIVPCYNYAHFLNETIACLIDQSLHNWECLLIDDGSTDDTESICTQWTKKDPRIFYFKKENGGLSSARNYGLCKANGLYIQFLDADDLIQKEKLLYQVSQLEQNKTFDVVYSSFLFLNEKKEFQVPTKHSIKPKAKDIFQSFIQEWEKGFMIPIHSFLFKKDLLTKVQGFNEMLVTHEDLELHLKIALLRPNYYCYNEAFAIYRIHNQSMSRNYTKMQKGFICALLSILERQGLSLYQRTIVFIRIGDEIAVAFTHFILRRKIHFFESISLKEKPIIIGLGLLLLPIFFFKKFISTFTQ